MFLLFIKFKFPWKNGIPVKIKSHLPQQLPPPSRQHYNNCSAPIILILFKKLLAPPI